MSVARPLPIGFSFSLETSALGFAKHIYKKHSAQDLHQLLPCFIHETVLRDLVLNCFETCNHIVNSLGKTLISVREGWVRSAVQRGSRDRRDGTTSRDLLG